MAEERINLVIGMAFREGNAVADAAATRARLIQTFREINASGTIQNPFNEAAVSRFGAALRREMAQLQATARQNPLLRYTPGSTAGLTTPSARDIATSAVPLQVSERALRQAELGLADWARTTRLMAARGQEITDLERYILTDLQTQVAVGRASLRIGQLNEREAVAAQRALAQQDIAATERSRLGGVGVSYPSADVTSGRGRLEERVNIAERDLALASQNLADARARSLPRAGELQRSERAEAAAGLRLAEAESRLATFTERQTRERQASLGAAATLGRQINRQLAEEQAARTREQAEARQRATRATQATQAVRDVSAQFGTPASVAESVVAERTQRLARATEAVAAVREQARTGELSAEQATRQMRSAMERESSAQRALTSAEQELERATRAQARSRGFQGQFAAGFRGRSETPYAEQLGQAFKFSLFYGTAYKAVFALTQVLQQTLQEGIQFQQAMTELTLSSGRTDNALQDLATNVGETAAHYGLAPSQGVTIAAKSLGLFGATNVQGATADQQDRVAEISARVLSQMSLNSGRQPEDIQTEVAAVANAFGLGAAGQIRLADLDAYFAKSLGSPYSGTLQAVAESGSVGQAAGFNLDETSAIAALLEGRTGQTPAAVAGYMAQIFSRGGEGSLTSVSSRYGIDPTADLATQIKELSQVYKTASPNEQAQISSAFGRGKVQNAVVALLENFDVIAKASEDAATEAEGASGKAADLRLDNIGGQISQTIGEMKDFASQLGKSGVLDIVGGAVVGFRELVSAGTELLRAWNQLPHVIRDTAIALGALAVASRVNAVTGALGGVGTRLGISRSAEAYAAGVPIGATRLSVATEAGAAPLASRAGARALVNAGGAALPIAAFVGVGIEYSKLSQSARGLRDAQDATANAMRSNPLTADSSPDQIRSRAGELSAQAGLDREAASGFWAGLIDRGQQSDKSRADAARLDAEASRLRQLATDNEAAAARLPANETLITGLDETSIQAGFDAITEGGGTAQTQLKALRDVLYGTADAAKSARSAFDPDLYAGNAAAPILDKIAETQKVNTITQPSFIGKSAFGLPIAGPLLQQKYGGTSTELTGPDQIRQALSEQEVKDRLAKALSGYSSLKQIDSKDANRIADKVIGDTIEKTFPDLAKEDLDTLRTSAKKAVSDYILGAAADLRATLEGDRQLTKQEVTDASNLALSTAQAALEGIPETDLAGITAAARKALHDQLRIRAHSKPPAILDHTYLGTLLAPAQESTYTEQAQDNLDAARHNLAESQFNELENLRRVAQQNAKSLRQVASVGKSFLRKEIDVAVRKGDRDLLAQIIGQAGKGAIVLAREALTDALRTAIAANKLRQQMAAAAASMIPIAGQILQLASTAAALAQNQDLLSMLNGLDSTLHNTGEGDVYTSGSDANLPAALTDDPAAEEEKETALERAAARAAARAARSESPIDAAKAGMLEARAAMAKAEKGTVEYYNALAQYYDARNQLTDAILDYKHNLALLGIDATDPLAVARLAVRDAIRKLRSDRGKGKDVIAADKVALQSAQAEQEATAFQQRLDAVQSAEELGRISFQKYLSYLGNEKRRLEGIKHRTFQQQQELDQIDKLMKEAADSMQGAWNFGDIKLPTPYQVRRYVEAQTGQTTRQTANQNSPSVGVAGTSRTEVHETTIYIDGADTAKVKQIIEEVVGRPGRTTTTSPRRF